MATLRRYDAELCQVRRPDRIADLRRFPEAAPKS